MLASSLSRLKHVLVHAGGKVSIHLLVNHFLLEFYCVTLLVEIQLLVGNTCNLLCVCAIMNSIMNWAGRHSQYRQAIA